MTVASGTSIVRMPTMPRLPITSLEQILARGRPDPKPLEAPPACWITGSWPVPEDTIVDASQLGSLAWTDEEGRLLSPPKPAFFQHVFGPGIPAYTIRTPGRPGTYHLAVLDRWRHPRATIKYRILPKLAASQSTFPAAPARNNGPFRFGPGGTGIGSLDCLGANAGEYSSVYIQAQVFRQHLSPVSQTHPGLRSQWIRANDGGIVLQVLAERRRHQSPRRIPRDPLAPRSSSWRTPEDHGFGRPAPFELGQSSSLDRAIVCRRGRARSQGSIGRPHDRGREKFVRDRSNSPGD